MPVETLPCITSLNEYVQKLPREHRARVYEIASAFLSIGAKDGILIFNGIKGEHDEMVAYLSQKQRETQAENP